MGVGRHKSVREYESAHATHFVMFVRSNACCTVLESGDCCMLYREHGQLTSSLVFFEDGVDCLSSLGGAMSGSVLTPFFCSGEFFASGPLPSNPMADVCRLARSHVVENAGAAACA